MSYLSTLRKEVNRNFRVKINGNGISTFVGMQGLINHLGYYRATSLCEAALGSQTDIYQCKLRRGLRIRFYVK